jgi:hypothetical protein
VGDKEIGACLLEHRERQRIGTCESKDRMDLNGRIPSRLPPVSTRLPQSGLLF